jgi:hypothetical protein
MRWLPGRVAVFAALVAFAAFAACAAPARAAILISVDKSAQQMIVTVDGDPRYIWPVSTGREGYDTPAGQFTPFRMEKDHFSREWDDAPMPYSIFFTKQGHAIHGTNHKISGAPESHGCVRLSVTHAAQLWELVKSQGMANVRVELDGRVPSRGELMARREPGSNMVERDERTTSQPNIASDPDAGRGFDAGRRPDDDPGITGDVAMSRDGSWHTYVENGRVYYYRDGPEEIRREPPPPRRAVRRYYRYDRGFPYW